jgi:methionine synthase II (cobalamin-independent)
MKGVYSPRVPTQPEMEALLRTALRMLPPRLLW